MNYKHTRAATLVPRAFPLAHLPISKGKSLGNEVVESADCVVS